MGKVYLIMIHILSCLTHILCQFLSLSLNFWHSRSCQPLSMSSIVLQKLRHTYQHRPACSPKLCWRCHYHDSLYHAQRHILKIPYHAIDGIMSNYLRHLPSLHIHRWPQRWRSQSCGDSPRCFSPSIRHGLAPMHQYISFLCCCSRRSNSHTWSSCSSPRPCTLRIPSCQRGLAKCVHPHIHQLQPLNDIQIFAGMDFLNGIKIKCCD